LDVLINLANDISLNVKEMNIEYKKVKGIYVLYNKINKKCYIGQTNNLWDRFRGHMSNLNTNHHPNRHLQKSANKYGISNFEGYVVEKVENENDLNGLELYYIKLLDSRLKLYGYNMKLDTYSREAENKSNQIGAPHPSFRKSVVQLSQDGKYISRFDGIVIASKETGASRGAIGLCCNKKARTSGGFMWLFESEYNNIGFNFIFYVDQLPKINRNAMEYVRKDGKKDKVIKSKIDYSVVQSSLEGEVLRVWDCPEQTREYGFNPNVIYDCCSGRVNKHKGFIWHYKHNIKKIKEMRNK